MTTPNIITAVGIGLVALLAGYLIGLWAGKRASLDIVDQANAREHKANASARSFMTEIERLKVELSSARERLAVLDTHAHDIGEQVNESAGDVPALEREIERLHSELGGAEERYESLVYAHKTEAAAGVATAATEGPDIISSESAKYRAFRKVAKLTPGARKSWNALATAVNNGRSGGMFKTWTKPPGKVSTIKASASQHKTSRSKAGSSPEAGR